MVTKLTSTNFRKPCGDQSIFVCRIGFSSTVKKHHCWLDDPDDYLRLDPSSSSRAESYRDYFNAGLCPRDIQNIEVAVMNCELTRCSHFERQVQGMLRSVEGLLEAIC